MEEGDNHLLIKFSDVAKLGGVANPAKSQMQHERTRRYYGETQVENPNEVKIRNKNTEII